MAENLRELKKRVAKEWQNAFPQLTQYSDNRFYKVIGPVMIGIELIKMPRVEEYRPHFVIYSLWGNGIKECLVSPFLLKEFKNKKGLQYSIPYSQNISVSNVIQDIIMDQTPLSFEGDVSVAVLFNVIVNYSRTRPLSAAPHSYWQALLQEVKLLVSLFIDESGARSVLEEINNRDWDENHFKMVGVNVDDWLQGLQRKIERRDDFVKQIEINKQDRKISKLESSKLIAM